MTPTEQIGLLVAISQVLQDRYRQLLGDDIFWNPKSLEQLVDEKQVLAVKDISDLKSNFWPEEESVDEFNNYIYRQRQEDLLSD